MSLAPGVSAQEVRRAGAGDQPAGVERGNGKTKNLIMAMRAPSSLTRAQLEETMEGEVKAQNQAADKTTVLFTWEGKAEIRAISKEVYDELARLIVTGFLPAGAKSGGPVDIEPFREQDLMWIVSLGNPRLYLKRLRIKYKEDDKDAEKVFDLEKDERLQFHSPGRYTLQVDGKVQPRSFVATVYDPKTKKEQDLPEVEWRATVERYWLIELRGFSGDMKDLLSVMQDDGKMVTAFRDMSEAQSSQVVVGSLTPDLVRPTTEFDGNNLVVRFPVLGKKEDVARRVWMLFPLKAGKWEKLVDELNGMPRLALVKLIRENAVLVDKTEPLVSKMEARWYEIPRVGGRFERSIPVEDLAGWKKLDDPRVWRLVVWEFDNGTIQGAKEVEHPRTKQPVKVVDEEVSQWPIGIKALAEKPPR